MADRKKFEEMLERLINEDREGAEELFHQLVVEKSRDIYESLLEDDADIEESDDEEVDEASKDEDEDEDKVDESSEEDSDEETNEDFNLDEFEVEADPMAAMGGDPADDMMADIDGGDDDEGGEDEGDEGDVEDRVEDLEDALEDLKAEFEKLMAGDDSEEGADDMDMDMGDEEGEEEGDEEKEAFSFEAEEEDEEDEVKETKATAKSSAEQMREYVEKVTAKMGDNGANTKSAVAAKNDMGGTAANIARGDTEAGVEANKGKLKGSALSDQTAKDMSTGNINVPGGKAAKSMKAAPKGHGAEKKGAGESADNKKSVVGK